MLLAGRSDTSLGTAHLATLPGLPVEAGLGTLGDRQHGGMFEASFGRDREIPFADRRDLSDDFYLVLTADLVANHEGGWEETRA